MNLRIKQARQLFKLIANAERRRLSYSVDVDVEQEKAKFIAAIGEADVAGVARLAAEIEADRILRNTAAEGRVLSSEEMGVFREMVQTGVLCSAASLGLAPPPSQALLARLDAFLVHRQAFLYGATPSSSGISRTSSAAGLW